MDETYGNGSQLNLFGFKISDVASSRQSYVSMKNPEISEVFRYAWKYPKGAYSIMTYTKTATWMRTLENLIGRKVMDEILQTYFERWKFKHPSGKDFITIVNEIVPKRLGNKFGKNMNWYFKQVLYTAPACDYQATRIQNNVHDKYIITVERDGGMVIPTEVLVTFQDNTQQLFMWDGKDRKKEFIFEKPIQSVWVDPETKNLLDLNIVNNSISAEQPRSVFVKYAVKIAFWMQTALQLFA
jgi:hypothetical protein